VQATAIYEYHQLGVVQLPYFGSCELTGSFCQLCTDIYSLGVHRTPATCKVVHSGILLEGQSISRCSFPLHRTSSRRTFLAPSRICASWKILMLQQRVLYYYPTFYSESQLPACNSGICFVPVVSTDDPPLIIKTYFNCAI
jgi:hypothetical protein